MQAVRSRLRYSSAKSSAATFLQTRPFLAFSLPLLLIVAQQVKISSLLESASRGDRFDVMEQTRWTSYEAAKKLRDASNAWARAQQPGRWGHPSGLDTEVPRAWFLWLPIFSCSVTTRFGRWGDGGKWICDPHRIPKNGSVIYSFGVRDDISFEKGLQEFTGAEVHAFDPTPFVVGIPNGPWTFHRLGLGAAKGTLPAGGDVDTLDAIMTSLGHDHIDVLKVDIEGGEWAFVKQWLDSPRKNAVDQFIVELHVPEGKQQGLTTDGMLKSLFDGLEDVGFMPFFFEPNYWGCDNYAEIAFVNKRFAKY